MTARDDGIPANRGPELNRRDTARQGDGDSGRWRPPWRVEGERPDTGSGSWADSWRRPGGSRFWLVLAGLLVLNWLLSGLLLAPPQRLEVPYTFFREQVEAGNVAEVTTTGDAIEGRFEQTVTYPPEDGVPQDDAGSDAEVSAELERRLAGQSQSGTLFTTQRPAFADDGLMDLLLREDVTVNAEPPDRVPVWQQLLFGFGPTILLVALLVWLARRSAAGAGLGTGLGLGKSKARRYSPEAGPRTTFADVAGIDDVEEEVKEIVDFLREPDRYRRLGATVPKGVLLAGPPGTGKTLLARAVAGEAGVPFFSVSAAEFIEMIVGVGASRVRDLFEQAKKDAPAIIFIDELDAIGRARGGGVTVGGHDEREQTLNQILTEMDGFDGSEGVVVMAATNRPEILDPALLRAGRFDRRVTVNPPDTHGRQQILAVHTRGVPVADDVDLAVLASATAGMVGADLRNLVNEAALLAARRNHDRVQMADFTDALEKIVLGAERKILLSPEERERTAYHESGHALLGMLTPGADPVRKISIIPRGMALGVTLQSPETDRYGYSRRYLRGRIVGALGGRAAEELVYGDITTGAENDLDQATKIARQMVGRWGMSEAVGPVSVLPDPRTEQPMALDGNGPAPATRELVDAEVRRILDECYVQAHDTLVEHRDRLERLASALLTAETLDADQAYEAAGLPKRQTVDDTLAPVVEPHRADEGTSRPGDPVPVGDR
ncbi:ATP-dependent zinc metalloprotease FtsH [Geodermatophilus sp. DSM 44513]|uniref:ATP-dependent zinc metalloprotease FtsH n=1 Tax=Geodermatophilus sp. DSM 44513 TaxID=1528104 RepID=UPI001284E0FD|nr:ATP-dependent zinc metalloprotease FtsH [Geodermatophilus sp. DSM 44513]WNV75250.1 ATP-dependent zinc metalloprotease FtsH [Geodermatophilus sp. DSM 44513]